MDESSILSIQPNKVCSISNDKLNCISYKVKRDSIVNIDWLKIETSRDSELLSAENPIRYIVGRMEKESKDIFYMGM